MMVFALRGSSVEVEYSDGSLVPANQTVSEMFAFTSGRKDRIEIGKYDALLLVSLSWGINLSRVLARCSVASGT